MKDNRRKFLKKVVAYGGLFTLSSEVVLAEDRTSPREVGKEKETLSINDSVFKPLESVTVRGAEQGIISVRDGKGQEYLREPFTASFSFQVGGEVGNQTIIFQDNQGKLLDFANFKVVCNTEIKDADYKFYELYNILHKSMLYEGKYAGVTRLNEKDKYYHYFVEWLRDHVHTLKGLKYFYHELKSGIDLYADFQRKDGMIWDNLEKRTQEKNGWDLRFAYDNFIMPIENYTYEFKRIPVENDVEYLFIEGLYYTWKATGDSKWMASRLDNALKALKYSTSNPYRWSEKYKLLKRGFTIDTWDFQANEDVVGYIGSAKDPMVIHKDKTRFGIMFGDNTGMAVSCRYLAEMLEYANRKEEAERVRQIGKELMERVNKLAWNGKFYTHHAPEDPTVKRDLGVEQSKQISLSNSYSLNRNLTHEQCVAIIKSYQEIRKEIPESSPGEWYSIYPPFPKGFDVGMWEYMNGGVLSIAAGELAHGAFEHGFEQYGVDIFDRLLKLARKHDNFLYCTYRGAMPKPPQRQFAALDLKQLANVDFFGTGGKNAIGWTGEGENDLHEMPVGQQTFHDIPFNIIDPAKNERRACVGLSGAKGYLDNASLSVDRTAKSIYFLHTTSGDSLAGNVSLEYQDGTSYIEYITEGKVGNFWFPEDPQTLGGIPVCKVAWRGANKVCPNVGVFVYGLNNPQPDKIIKSIKLERVKTNTKWFVIGVTLCDAPVFFMPSEISYGIPDNWGAAAVFYALMEGLAGIKDTGVAFDKALLAPRWEASGTNEVMATAKYEASGGYMSYQYKFVPEKKQLWLTFTGSAKETQVEIMLPKSTKSVKTVLNGKEVNSTLNTIETSSYACLKVEGLGVHKVIMNLI